MQLVYKETDGDRTVIELKSLVLIVFICNGSLVLPLTDVSKVRGELMLKKINYINFVYPVCKFQIFRIKLERLLQIL